MRYITVIFALLFTSALTTAAPQLRQGARGQVYYDIPDETRRTQFLAATRRVNEMIKAAYHEISDNKEITKTRVWNMLGLDHQSHHMLPKTVFLHLYGLTFAPYGMENLLPGDVIVTLSNDDTSMLHSSTIKSKGNIYNQIILYPKAFSGINAVDSYFESHFSPGCNIKPPASEDKYFPLALDILNELLLTSLVSGEPMVDLSVEKAERARLFPPLYEPESEYKMKELYKSNREEWTVGYARRIDDDAKINSSLHYAFFALLVYKARLSQCKPRLPQDLDPLASWLEILTVDPLRHIHT